MFDIDISVCMSCQICVEVCPFEAIKMDTEFELSTTDRFGGLLMHKHELAKSNEYYHKIHPTEATKWTAGWLRKRRKPKPKQRPMRKRRPRLPPQNPLPFLRSRNDSAAL